MIESQHIANPVWRQDAPPSNFEQARLILRARVDAVLSGRNGVAPGHKGIVRVTVPVASFALLPWLDAQVDPHKVYWSGRTEDQPIAAVGSADRWGGGDVSGLAHHLKQRLAGAASDVRYFGGLCFDVQQPTASEWEAFGAGSFTLPRIEATAHALACNLVLPRDRRHASEILAALDALVPPSHAAPYVLPVPIARRDVPQADTWQEMIEWALAAFDKGHLGKVVFARKTIFDFAEKLNPLALLYNLKQAAPNRFHFLFQPQAGVAFLGASPERLFFRSGTTVQSEAVAGTRPRSTSAADDARLWQELVESDKDQREHGFVRDYILDTLGQLTRSLDIDAEASEMKLAQGRHLVSAIEGRLRPDVDSTTLLKHMHPTPAVGGYPRRAAMDAIAEQEPFARGWYAGPVGWIGKEAAEFSVAIRSGLVTAQQLALYSGAGIVAGSTPASEWDEIEHKIIDFSNVLGLDLRRAK